MHVLLIEDEPKIGRIISRALRENAYVVDIALTGPDGLQLATACHYDAILLDVLLPGLNGIEVCQRLRRLGLRTPVLMLTAQSLVEQRVEGLDAGADDYLVKPFAISELLARLRALVRRGLSERSTTMSYADLELDTRNRCAKRSGSVIALSKKEFLLLELLLARAPNPVTRSEVIEYVWGLQFDRDSNLVEVYISRLRDKIDRDQPPRLIQTVRGAGYKIGLPE
ncbi:MAG: response regulator transcription factor [Acidobacteriota bacterium]|nr:response regulator transcription factor [Acidobacteriota bacterium]